MEWDPEYTHTHITLPDSLAVTHTSPKCNKDSMTKEFDKSLEEDLSGSLFVGETEFVCDCMIHTIPRNDCDHFDSSSTCYANPKRAAY